MKEIIEKAREYALKEIELNKSPSIEFFDLANENGRKIAKTFEVDQNIVMLGTILMDLKIGECIKEGKIPEHIDRSSKAAQEFLNQFDLDEETKNKIVNCIEAHHGTKEYICKEAEICANADCYRFLHPKGVLTYLTILGKRFDNLNECLDQLEKKMEEKHNILSLDLAKEELEPYYQQFKELIKKAKVK
jgi:hypothetical protein|tara:strand:+ start:976 stop:1545 length:570 start_codon:yes stop_codon:yes gene_type:complete